MYLLVMFTLFVYVTLTWYVLTERPTATWPRLLACVLRRVTVLLHTQLRPSRMSSLTSHGSDHKRSVMFLVAGLNVVPDEEHDHAEHPQQRHRVGGQEAGTWNGTGRFYMDHKAEHQLILKAFHVKTRIQYMVTWCCLLSHQLYLPLLTHPWLAWWSCIRYILLSNLIYCDYVWC